MTVPLHLDGDVAVVTGAARGIGEATAQLLARAGARVAVADIDADGARTAAEKINGDGGHAMAVTMDVTRPDAVAAAVDEIGERLGPPTVLVNNAFRAALGPFTTADLAALTSTVDVILLGAMHTCRAVLPGMLTAGRGRIVNVISDAGRVGEAGMVAYSAAKAGLAGLTWALAKEVGSRNITVNGVSPGATRTATTLAQLQALSTDETALAARYPLRRLGEPDDVAYAVLFLASPLAGWITGQVLGVNGGYSTG